MEVVKVEMTKNNKDEVKEAIEGAILDWLDLIGNDAASVAANKAPVDTGTLKKSISHAVVASEFAVYIGTNVEYAIYHELGTGIYATGGGGRKTPWAFKDKKGKWHYTKGVPAKHFLQFGATAHQNKYRGLLESKISEALKE